MFGLGFMAFWIAVLVPFAFGIIVLKGAYAIIHGAKIVMALLVAFLINANAPLFDIGFLSYCAWAAICVVSVYLLCFLPRIECAFQFLSTAVISFLVAYFVLSSIYPGILSWFGKSFEYTLWVDIIVRIVCTVVSVYIAYDQFSVLDIDGMSDTLIIGALDRAVASIGYGIGACVLFATPVGSLWSCPEFVQYIVIGVVAVAYFIYDCYEHGVAFNILPIYNHKQKMKEAQLRHEAATKDDSFDFSEDTAYEPYEIDRDFDDSPSLEGSILSGNLFGGDDDNIDDYL